MMMYCHRTTTTLVGVILGGILLVSQALKDICTSETNTFHVKVNLFAGELGYYYFEECGDQTNPTIGIEIGQTYTFDQSDKTNYYHPMGFAYFPDGAHRDKPELEPTVSWKEDAHCTSSGTCPTPLYFEGDEFLGDANDLTVSFGLDVYEPLFFHPTNEWNAQNFSIQLTFDDESYKGDIFYFCHIHSLMSARIKLLKNGRPINEEDKPALTFKYDVPGEFDAQCGTFGLDEFQLPNPECPTKFVCGTEEQSEEMQSIARCYDAFNCHMMSGMTTKVRSGSEIALFIHQMIPHHQNAVNMAKNLLFQGSLKCNDILDEEKTDCVLENLMREMINSQNMQIQGFRDILSDLSLPEEDDCLVTVTSSKSYGSRKGDNDSDEESEGGDNSNEFIPHV